MMTMLANSQEEFEVNMQKRKLFQLFKGKPNTAFRQDRNGNTKVDVTIRELSPLRAKLADGTAVLLT